MYTEMQRSGNVGRKGLTRVTIQSVIYGAKAGKTRVAQFYYSAHTYNRFKYRILPKMWRAEWVKYYTVLPPSSLVDALAQKGDARPSLTTASL